MEVIVPKINEDYLFYLLQTIYFDNIDNANASDAVEAMHDSVKWIHTQVWEHDGHKSDYVDNLIGVKAVKEFLTERVKEMQIEGIKHKVNKVLTDGISGSFQADVIGKDGVKKPFFGWVEIEDQKIISYRVLPG
tara:strand:- start:1656 stop:2057 length:402 start_codon:yes stop_codon:yes gene_type:complete